MNDCELRMTNYENVINIDHVSAILMFLSDREYAFPTQIKDNVYQNYSRLGIVLKELEEAGLISMVKIREQKFEIHVSLTEKGKEVAKKLKEIDDIIKSS